MLILILMHIYTYAYIGSNPESTNCHRSAASEVTALTFPCNLTLLIKAGHSISKLPAAVKLILVGTFGYQRYERLRQALSNKESLLSACWARIRWWFKTVVTYVQTGHVPLNLPPPRAFCAIALAVSHIMSLDLSPTSDCFEAFLRLWLWESRPQHLLPLVAPPPLPTINRQVLQAHSYSSTLKVPNQW